ncbi:MAG: hypothetical protein LQ339_000331 [Xanthoria mediterranea]|nr:MAG: hypothetical protein LQ339_000331 [Xanthoria mediterranea]
MIDDLATTRKAGAKYFHELFQRGDCVLAGHVKSQLQDFFRKKPTCSRADLHSDALDELVKWESLAPVEGTMEYDKARVRNVRDYLIDERFAIEKKRGLVMDDHDLGRALHLQQSELGHEAANRSQKLRRVQKLYKRRAVAPPYHHDGKMISDAAKDKIEQKEIDRFWGYDDASEEEAVSLHGDEQAMGSGKNEECHDFGNMDDDVVMGAGDVGLKMERCHIGEQPAFNSLAYRLHPNIGEMASVEEQDDTSNASVHEDADPPFRPR